MYAVPLGELFPQGGLRNWYGLMCYYEYNIEKGTMTSNRIYSMSIASVYPLYVAKAVKKGRTKAEVDQIICWLTGHTKESLEAELVKGSGLQVFFDSAPMMNPLRARITGVVCGVRVEEIEDPVMREIRYLDKLVDELAKGRPMEKILRTAS